MICELNSFQRKAIEDCIKLTVEQGELGGTKMTPSDVASIITGVLIADGLQRIGKGLDDISVSLDEIRKKGIYPS